MESAWGWRLVWSYKGIEFCKQCTSLWWGFQHLWTTYCTDVRKHIGGPADWRSVLQEWVWLWDLLQFWIMWNWAWIKGCTEYQGLVASILQPGETRTFGLHILHLFTAWSWTGGFYLFEQLSTQPRLRNREISTSKLSKHKHRHPTYTKAMKLAAGRPFKLWQMYSAACFPLFILGPSTEMLKYDALIFFS
jgi:hypothetical protein